MTRRRAPKVLGLRPLGLGVRATGALWAVLLFAGCLVDFSGDGGRDAAPPTDATVGQDASGIPDAAVADAVADAALVDAAPDAASACHPGNCAGCCAPGGMCQTGILDTSCGTGGEACEDCTVQPGYSCNGGTCHDLPCQDGDGDGFGVDCLAGADACDNDINNWTTGGCANCADADGDGVRGTACDVAEDPCDSDDLNWTAGGCAGCADVDGDGLRGTGCDEAEDCDDGAPGVAVACQANGCPLGWVHIPAGTFQMGCNSGELDGTCETDEQPRHTVTLTAYCIEVTEVTVGDFRACKTAGQCSGVPDVTGTNALCNYSANASGRESHPLNCVYWADTREYCQDWLGADLPTEAQWEKAARGAGTDQRKYPWGSSAEPDCSHCNWNQCHSTSAPSTWPVGTLSSGAGDSPFGLKDMAGNLWEFTLDTYVDNIYQTCASGCTDPSNLTTGGYKTIRGGGYYHPTASYLRVTERSGENDTSRSLNAGFRCVRTP